jgi:hypothetical protein
VLTDRVSERRNHKTEARQGIQAIIQTGHAIDSRRGGACGDLQIAKETLYCFDVV